MPKEFIIRGRTNSGGQEVINLSGYRPGYGYSLTEFVLYPSSSLGGSAAELIGTVTAETTGEDPANPNFNNDGLIATFAYMWSVHAYVDGMTYQSVINDLFVCTQDLILMVQDAVNSSPVNWQLRFKEVKLSESAEAVANYKQYSIYNTEFQP